MAIVVFPRSRVARLVAAGAAVVGLAALWVATPAGLGLTTDSVTYLAGARELADHPLHLFSLGGPVGDFDLWPPFYSAVLAVPGVVGIDPLDGARAVSAAVLLATWLLAFLLV